MTNLSQLPTPCLVLDLDAFERNIEKMSRFAADRHVALRPHAKTHKCIPVARRQIDAGAVGICAATIAEAEVLARGGIRGLLITAELVGEPKVSRFVELLETAPDSMLVVDDPVNVAELQAALEKSSRRACVLIDLDVGQNRTGVLPGQPARDLARTIAKADNLELAGICAYAGHLAHCEGFEQRKERSTAAWNRALETRDQLVGDGHNIRIMTGVSTGTYNIDSSINGVTELQAGSYVFMDVEYRGIHRDFEPALNVLATVTHRSGDKAVVDAGLKAFATDRPYGPDAVDINGITYQFAGDEHGRLIFDEPSKPVHLGDKMRFIPPHCDPTVNLYDRIHCLRGEEVVDVWPIMERSGPYF